MGGNFGDPIDYQGFPLVVAMEQEVKGNLTDDGHKKESKKKSVAFSYTLSTADSAT